MLLDGSCVACATPQCNKLCRMLLTASIRGILFNQHSAWPQVIGAFLAASRTYSKGPLLTTAPLIILDTVSCMFAQMKKMNINDDS